MDNCEHLIRAAAQLVEKILRACAHVQILATSRERLNIPGEGVYRVPPLSMPVEKGNADQASLGNEAVQLFIERARNIEHTFELTETNAAIIARICRRLDGIPLAIELASARINALSPSQIEARLDDRFRILGGRRTSLQRHQTLQAAIDWSYDLLSDSERVLLQRLSVFSGGWKLEAAEAVVTDRSIVPVENALNLLGQLVDKSLVTVDFQAEPRYHMLETVRQYALERLARSGEQEGIERQHFDFYFDLVQEAEVGLKTSDRQFWLRRLDAEKENLRAAFGYGQSLGRHKQLLHFAGGLYWFWQTLGYIREGRSVLENILRNPSKIPANEPSAVAARATGLWAAGSLAWIQTDYTVARSRLEESVRLWRQLAEENELGLAITLRELGFLLTTQDELDYARPVLEESIHLMMKAGANWDLALAFYNLGLVYEAMEDVTLARVNFDKSLSLFGRLNQPWGLSVALYGFGRMAGRQGDYRIAQSHLEEALELFQRLNDRWSSAGVSYLLGEVARLQENYQQAIEHYSQSLVLNQTVGDKAMNSFALHNLGKIVHLQGRPQSAACLFSAAKALREDSINTMSWSLTDPAECEQDIAALLASIGEEAFRPAWIEGQAMLIQGLEQVVEYAMASTESFE
jgi:predicted ATPase/Flp pilus assembly protein TadD